MPVAWTCFKKRGLCLALIGLSSGALAEDFQPMTGAEIEATLNDTKLIYAEAWQEFRASGRTLYNAGADSWGYWRVQGDQYCSEWPPNAGWDCYDMARSGDVIRFIDAWGNETDGQIAPSE